MKTKKQFTNRILSLALALVMVLGMVPHLSLEAHAAISETLTVDGLTYTITVQSATDKNGNNKMGEIEGILLYSTPSRSGSKVSFQAYMIGYMSLATYSFTETSCTEKLTATTSNQMGNGNKVVLSITRSAASHTGGTCTSPTCSRCQKTYDAPHDYKWKNDGTNHWQECTRDASHKTSHSTCSGGTAYCQAQAVCSTCQNPHGSTNPDNHKWGSWGYAGSEGDCRECTLCGTEEKYRDHVYLTPPTCTKSEQCQLCGWYFTDSDNHNWSATWSYNDTQHWQVCTRDSSHTQNRANHSGGNANCTTAGTCTTCGGSYKDTQAHDYIYTANDNTITEICKNDCGHSATATLTATDATYTGAAITTGASVTYSDGWGGSQEHGEITYSNNLNAGTATAKVTVEGKELTTTFEINEADISDAVVSLNPTSGTYTGTAYDPSVSVTLDGFGTLAEGTDYTLSWDKTGFTNADTYTVTVTGKGNYEGTKNAVFSILPADIKGAVVTLDQHTFVYNGQPHKPTVIVTFNGAMLTEGVDYELYYMSKDQIIKWENDEPVRFFGYESSDSINAGQYYAVAVGKGNYAANNHFAYAAYTITQAGNAWVTEPSISGWTYGKTAKAPVGAAKFGDVSVEYSGTANDGTSYISTIAPTKAGNYTATFTVSETENYSGLETSVDFIIAKAYYNMTGAKWDYREPFQYNGKEHKVEVVGLPTGVTVESYENNTATAVGDYYAEVNLTYDAHNYNAPTISKLGWTIYNDWTPAEYTVNGSGWMNEDFVITANDGFKASLTNTAGGEWNESLTFSAETADGSVTFYLKDETSGAISLAKTVSYKIDKTAPTGKVEFVERTGWEEFVHTITFGLFYKDEVTVKITGADTLSGVAKIEHYESNEAKTLDEVMEIADWPEYNGSFGVALEDAKKFVYFVRITDNAGNVTYLSSDGAEYDTTAPAIEGIENGKTYYTTQKVTVTDKNLDTVTVNGSTATGIVILDGNKDVTYTIAATDKAGNTTTVTVTMKPIKELAKAAEDLTHDNVTSADASVLQELIAKLDELIADPDTSDDGERETLEQHKVIAESLLKTIEDAAKAADTENTEKVKDVTAENVTPENKADLENAKADLEKALEDNMGNYTEEEKQEIAEEIRRIENAIEALENVERVTDAITQLPDTVEPDDEEAAEKILDAKKAYDELTDHEKSLVSEDVKKKLDDLVASLTAYDIIKGDGSAWTKDSGSTISFTANGPFSKFVGIQVDGVAVDKANYEAKAGSTIITLKASYLDTLKVGEHTITIVYNDGSTDGTFKILANPNTPATGDDFNIPLYSSLMAVSVIALVVLLLDARKRKYTK